VIGRFLAKDPAQRPAATEAVALLGGGSGGGSGGQGGGYRGGQGDYRGGQGDYRGGQQDAGAKRGVAHDDTVTAVRSGGGGTTEQVATASRQWRTLLMVGVPVVLVAAAVGGFLAASHSGPTGSLAGLTHSPTPKPKPTPPPAVGDACLVGTWRDGGYEDTTTWDKTTVYLHGGAGNLDHIYASGIDDNTYGSYTAPFYGTYDGSTLQVNYNGTRVSTIRATERTHQATVTSSGWTSGSAPTFLYQGETSTGTFNQDAASTATYGYQCTATTLTWISDGTVADTETRVSSTP
jgi:hypothetical protein